MRRCCMCHQEKPDSDFAFRSATGVRQDHCRVCHAAYRRQHYLDHREEYIAREVARMKSYRLDNRARILEYLSSHACVDCGEAEPLVLDFDHRERDTKRSEVARLSTCKPWKIVSLEISKCDVRCGNCHRRRTAQQLGWAEKTVAAQAVKPVRESVVARGLAVAGDALRGDVGVLRRCTGCFADKPLTEYSVKNWKTGRRATRCHTCIAAVSRAHYWKDQQPYMAKARKNRQKNRDRNRVNKSKHLVAVSCVDCGEPDPVVLEFDHRERESKVANVSRMMARHTWSTVLTEIAKCEIRCVNCHRRRTAAQFGWIKQSLQEAAKMAATRE